MPIDTECPLCAHKGKAPDQLKGKQVKCPECCNLFVVGGGAVAVKTAQSHPGTSKIDSRPVPAKVSPAKPVARNGSTTPFGNLDGGTPSPVRSRRRRQGGAFALVFWLLLLIGLGVGGWFGWTHWLQPALNSSKAQEQAKVETSTDSKAEVASQPVDKGNQKAEAVRDELIDVSKGPAKVAGAQIRVVSVAVDTPPGKDIAAKEPRFIVKFQIENTGTTRVDYFGWSEVDPAADSSGIPVLVDPATDMKYKQANLGAGVKAEGQVLAKTLQAGEWVDDLLIFDVPADKTLGVKLVLPARNLKVDGEPMKGKIKLFVPRSMWGAATNGKPAEQPKPPESNPDPPKVPVVAQAPAQPKMEDKPAAAAGPNKAPFLRGSQNEIPGTVDLTAVGTLDWVHFGLNQVGDRNQKKVDVSQIAEKTVGPGALNRYADSPCRLSWSDGGPTASTGQTPTGMYITGVQSGWEFTIPADTTPRLAHFYLGVYKGEGKFEAFLSDQAVPLFVDSFQDPAGSSHALFKVHYRGSAAGQKLTVRWTLQSDKGGGNVTVQAVALARGPDQAAVVKEQGNLTEDDATDIATDAYVFGYPLVTAEIARRVTTNAVDATDGRHAPMGQLAHHRVYAAPLEHFPSVDTLSSVAWLDLSKEPYIFGDCSGKGYRGYWAFTLFDAYTNVLQVTETRSVGGNTMKYAITGPRWVGKLPDGVTEWRAPTNLVMIRGRIPCFGADTAGQDAVQYYKEVHAMQDVCSLVPLSAFGQPVAARRGVLDKTIDMKTSVREQVNRMDAAGYFKTLAALMKDNPPTGDASILTRMARIGIVPGQDFDITKLDPAVAKALQRAPKAGQEKIAGQADKAMIVRNGWRFPVKVGTYGTDYLQRAYFASYFFAIDPPQQLGYAIVEADADGKPLLGTQRYVLHFPQGAIPRGGYFSMTLYNDKDLFAPNPLNRFHVSQEGPRNRAIENGDGTNDIYFGKMSPGPGPGKETNWLPTPDGKFKVMLRLFWPNGTFLDGSWQPPTVKRAG